MKTNAKLDALAAPHLTRPQGRPPAEGYERVIELGSYQIDSWRHVQRLILVVVDQPDPVTGQLNLLPRYFFLITSWSPGQRSGKIPNEGATHLAIDGEGVGGYFGGCSVLPGRCRYG